MEETDPRFNYSIYGLDGKDYMRLEDLIALLNQIEQVEREYNTVLDKSLIAEEFQRRADEEDGKLPIVYNEEAFK